MPLTAQKIETYRMDGLVIPSTYLDTHGYSNRVLFLLRGEDRTGRNDFTRGHTAE